MNNRMNDLSDEVKANLVNCKTEEEKKKVLADAGIEPIDDELLDEVSAGVEIPRLRPRHRPRPRGPRPSDCNIPGDPTAT